MKTALAILAILSIALIPAYAESYEDTVKFDLFNNSTVDNRGCFFSETDDGLTYNCQWNINTLNATKFFEEAETAFEEYVDKVEEENPNIVFEDTVETKLTQTERLIEKLNEDKDRGNISTADKELLRLLQATQRACELGIEHGERLQQYANFALPDTDPRIETATDFTTNWELGNIVKKFEECEAWNEYRVNVLGQQYLDMDVDDSTSQKTHRQMVQSLETFPVPRLDEHDFVKAEQQAQEWICSASYYDRFFKAEQGCFDEVVLEERNISNPLDRNSSYTAYKEYLSTGHVDLDSLKKQEVDKANAQSLQSFALQHGIDIAALKNLVNPVDEYNESKINGAQ